MQMREQKTTALKEKCGCFAEYKGLGIKFGYHIEDIAPVLTETDIM